MKTIVICTATASVALIVAAFLIGGRYELGTGPRALRLDRFSGAVAVCGGTGGCEELKRSATATLVPSVPAPTTKYEWPASERNACIDARVHNPGLGNPYDCLAPSPPTADGSPGVVGSAPGPGHYVITGTEPADGQ